jgi:hypothetical protein
MSRRKRLVCQVQSNDLCYGGCWDGFRGIMSCMPDYNLLQPDILASKGLICAFRRLQVLRCIGGYFAEKLVDIGSVGMPAPIDKTHGHPHLSIGLKRPPSHVIGIHDLLCAPEYVF